jgi:hypothetical protein
MEIIRQSERWSTSGCAIGGRDGETYGAGGGTLKGLLALDGDVGAIGSLELDVEGGCRREIGQLVDTISSCLSFGESTDLGSSGRSPC